MKSFETFKILIKKYSLLLVIIFSSSIAFSNTVLAQSSDEVQNIIDETNVLIYEAETFINTQQ